MSTGIKARGLLGDLDYLTAKRGTDRDDDSIMAQPLVQLRGNHSQLISVKRNSKIGCAMVVWLTEDNHQMLLCGTTWIMTS